MQTRRELAKAALYAPLAAAWARNAAAKTIDSKINGVMIGAQSYSFRDRPLDAAIQAYVDCGLGYAELWQGHLEPKGKEEAKKWRTSAPAAIFKEVRRKFDNAGVKLVAFNYSFRDEYTDAEIDHGFKMTQWMGLNKITASSNVDVAKRVSPYADKYKIYVGFHNHASMKPNEFSTPKDFAEALKGNSKYLRINLDIGHATAAGWDPVQYLSEHHDKIVTLHLKDRSANHDGKQGENLPWGEGTTKISAVLLLLKQKKWQIPANIEYEYGRPGMDTIAEVKKCYDYCKKVLA
jgi:sugar phosphate isomerase/epimerase